MLKTPQRRTEITTMQNPVLVSPQCYAGIQQMAPQPLLDVVCKIFVYEKFTICSLNVRLKLRIVLISNPVGYFVWCIAAE